MAPPKLEVRSNTFPLLRNVPVMELQYKYIAKHKYVILNTQHPQRESVALWDYTVALETDKLLLHLC